MDNKDILKKQLTLIQETIQHERKARDENQATFKPWLKQLETVEKQIMDELGEAIKEAVCDSVEKAQQEAKKLCCADADGEASCCCGVVLPFVSNLLKKA